MFLNTIKKHNNTKGIALPITLFILSGIFIASMILSRSGELSLYVSGQVGDKVQVSGSNDIAIVKAINWLENNKATLAFDNFDHGYLSSTPLNQINFFEESSWVNFKSLDIDSIGNRSDYQIIRLCSIANAEKNSIVDGINNTCANATSAASTAGENSSIGYNSYQYSAVDNSLILYKIITRTIGPKDVTTISEVITAL